MSAPAEGDTNLPSADHIVSYYIPLAAEEQHLFRVPGSLENDVSEPARFVYTLLSLSPHEISWLVPWGGSVNRYLRGVDGWIIWLPAFIQHYTKNMLHWATKSFFFTIKKNDSYLWRNLGGKNWKQRWCKVETVTLCSLNWGQAECSSSPPWKYSALSSWKCLTVLETARTPPLWATEAQSKNNSRIIAS